MKPTFFSFMRKSEHISFGFANMVDFKGEYMDWNVGS